MRPARLAQPVRDLRRVGRHRAARLVLAVQDAQRVVLDAISVLVPETVPVGLEVRDQLRAVRRPAHLVAQAVELDPVAGQPEAPQEPVAHHDHLDVGRRVGRAHDLDAELPMLAIPARLGPPVPVHPREVVGLEGRGKVVPVVQVKLNVVLERVHLLAHDVAGLPGRPAEQLRVLERRRLHVAVAVRAGQGRGAVVQRADPASLGRQEVHGPPGRREVHGLRPDG